MPISVERYFYLIVTSITLALANYIKKAHSDQADFLYTFWAYDKNWKVELMSN